MHPAAGVADGEQMMGDRCLQPCPTNALYVGTVLASRDVASCNNPVRRAAAALFAGLQRPTAAWAACNNTPGAAAAAGSAPGASHSGAGCAGAAGGHAVSCRAGGLCAEQDRGHW